MDWLHTNGPAPPHDRRINPQGKGHAGRNERYRSISWHTSSMLAGVLPGLQQMRAPFAAGATWLVTAWALWGRHLPSRNEATGFLRDFFALAEYLGTVAMLGVIAFVAYLIGVFWVMAREALITDWGLVRLIPNGPLRNVANILSPWVLNSSARTLIQSFTVSNVGKYRNVFIDLLPRLGACRPDADTLNEETLQGIQEALFADLNRADVLMRDRDSELLEEHIRDYAEFRFRAAMAVPLGVCSSVLIFAATDGLIGSLVALLVGAMVWFAIGWSAAQANLSAYTVLLQAVYLGRLPAPALTEYVGTTFGWTSPQGPSLPTSNHPD